MVLLKSCRLTALAVMLFAVPAYAHQLWLEQDGDKAVLYYGEFNENLREASPGFLDRIAPKAQAVSASGARDIDAAKGSGGFALATGAKAGESLLVEDTHFPIAERKTGDKTIRTARTMGARQALDFEVREPRLVLDIVPAGKPGAFKVFFKDKPLAKAKVEVIAASGWAREMRTDAQGALEVPLPWQGRYVVLVEHTDPTAGERAGAAYDVASYVSTLSFVTKDGVASPQAPPAATPHK
jgi:hypothetical protein